MIDISNCDNIMDSRDFIARLDELTDMLKDVTRNVESGRWENEDGIDFDHEHEEHEIIRAVCAEGENWIANSWVQGVMLIRDSYFTEYAEEFAHEIGAINSNAGWPLNYLDWEAAADALKMDYLSVNFNGVEYWFGP